DSAMTIGSTANIAAALEAIKESRSPGAMPPIERLALLLISDRLGMGATQLDVRTLHALLGTEDPSEAKEAVTALSRRGLLLLSRWRDDVAFIGSTIATEQEISDARRALGCDWHFIKWTGAT